MKTIYVSDLDGTLLDPSGVITGETASVINGLIKRGLCFTIATARSWTSAKVKIAPLNIALPLVCLNGTQLVEPSTGRMLDGAALSPDTIESILSLFEDFGLSPTVHTFINGEEKLLWVRSLRTAGLTRYLDDRKGDKRLMSVETYGELRQGDIHYIALIDGMNAILPAMPSINAFSREICSYSLAPDTYYPQFHWLEIFPHGVSKGTGIRKLKELLGCDRVVCFGDNRNDLPMFEEADYGCAVANSVPELKSIASEVIGDNGSEAVARWLSDNATFPE